MSIIATLNELKHIPVLNYNASCVCIKVSPDKSIKLDAANGNDPFVIPLTLDEIRFANNGSVFKTGTLEFPVELEEEVYEELRIDTSKVLKLSEIRNILLSPTKNGLIKIISIQSLSDFDRVRGQFQKLKQEGHKLTLDIANIIDRRTKELFNNQFKTSIQISDAEAVQNNEKVAALERELASMKSLLDNVLAQKDVEQTSVEEEKKEASQKTTTSVKKTTTKSRIKKTTE